MRVHAPDESWAAEIPGINNKVLCLLANSRDAQAFLVFPVMELAVLHALGASLDFRDAHIQKFYRSADRLPLNERIWPPAVLDQCTSRR
ncbi:MULTISPECIES: hypothetical protein [unclassified Pseudomonas]|uniref:hypothetical protein n=1 Tax=unclassified Pseudomonas TaxID=196821 RepID=UPI001304CE4C|nr:MULTISPECIES: hypothetical protein [unclassified Pseudomonas]